MWITARQRNQALAAVLAERTGLDVRTTETGGGCDAIMATVRGQWTDPDAAHVLITAALDQSVPLDENGAYLWGVHVGAYVYGDTDEPTTLLEATIIEEGDTDATTNSVAAALVAWRNEQDPADPEPTPGPLASLPEDLRDVITEAFGDAYAYRIGEAPGPDSDELDDVDREALARFQAAADRLGIVIL
jgi:hypothetical protein